MNKLRYRVIFNKTRGLLMAVSELGRSHGAGLLDGGQAGPSGMAVARLRPLVFAALVLAGAQLQVLPMARAQIVADPSAPRAQQPVVLNTASGVPQVNITTPSAAGVSRNTYSQFDVNKPGAILNNARNDVQTQTGGWVQRNPNLANGTARVILNEVNSSHPSFLRGYVEVAGDRAQVVIANPSGITCDGCGFINASRTTLTTGTAVMNNGSLDGFVVRRGTVTVQGDGMDASQSDYTNIIARAVRVNAGIWSRELRVTSGANRVDSDNQVIQKQGGDDGTPAFAIDVAQLGGMYANKIILVGTEAGVGMRNAGSIGAAAGEVRISADGHIENSGKIQSNQGATLSATGLDNRGGKLQAAGDIDIRLGSGVLDNRRGLIETATQLGVQAASIVNSDTRSDTQGMYGKTLRLDADRIDNTRGTLRADASLGITAAGTVDNSAGAISAGGDISINDRSDAPASRTLAVNNQSGLIESAASLSIKAARLANTGTSGDDQGLHAKRLMVDADTIDNTRGSMLANDSVALAASGRVDNSSGTISAGGALRIADRNADTSNPARTLAISNTAGKLEAGTSNLIDSAALSGDGQILSQQSTTIRLTGDFNNTGTVRGNGDVAIDSGGNVRNDGLIQAGSMLRIKAPTIMNGTGGSLIGNRLQLDTTDATDARPLINRGLIDGQDTFITTQVLRNLGTGRIYGDHVAIAASRIDNEAETVDGVSSAPVIAARDRLDIGTETLNNREHATLYAGGDMAIGGELDANKRATGQAGTVNNNSATIEAQGALELSARTVNNTNEHFSTEVAEVARENKREFQYSGSSVRYDDSQVAIINDESDDMWIRDANGKPSIKLGNDFNRYDYTRVTTETRVKDSDPGKITAGGGMRITADVVNNDKSQIIAGGALSGRIGTLNNTEVAGERTITDVGKAIHFYNMERRGRDEQGSSETDYRPAPVIQAISLTPSLYQQNTAVAGSGTQVGALNNAAMGNGVRVPGVALVIGGGGAIRLSNSSLFSINTNPALHYLVQSDPRFTNYRNWLSSDYMLNQLGADPTLTQKRLGDGFYEQKLVREQIAELTGRRFLDGYGNDEAQYLALLDAGVTVSKQYNLKVGVALTAAQIAALTSDVVLLVEKDVTMPDGSTTRALVPQLYVRLKDGDINGYGALLAADSVDLKVGDSINNSGTIAGRNLLNVSAININNNGGRITAKDSTLTATQDINNQGGTLDAGDKLSVNAGRDLNLVSTTHDSSTSQATRTSIERVATLYVANPGGTLTATAARDINGKAAQIANAGAGGTTTLVAGNNVNLETVTEKSAQSLTWNAKNYRKESLTSEVGSSIAASGDVRVMAGNDINVKGLSATSENGAINLAAANSVNISTATSTQKIDEGHQTSGSSGWLSKKTVTTRYLVDQSQEAGSTISGNTVSVTAGKDINVSGSNVVSSAGTTISAANNVNIAAASNKADNTFIRNEVTSGMFSGGSFGATVGKQQIDNKNRTLSSSAVSSTVGSTKGNVAIAAGNAYAQTGSSVLAPKGDIEISAKKVDINAASDSERNTQDMVFKQSGLTLQITSPVLSAVQTVQQMKKAAEATSDGRMQALAAANVGFAGKNAYDAVKTGQGFAVDGKANPQVLTNARNEDGSLKTGADGNPETRDATAADKVGGINLAISLGSSKSESHAEAKASTARSSTVAAGGNVNITASGGGADSNITIQGSDIKAGVNASLKAENEVRLLAAQSTTEQHSTNKGMSASVGVSVGTDGLIFNAGASGNRGRGDGSDVTQVNTHVDAGNKLSISSGTDTTLKGAVVSGKQVVMDVGTSGSGNLNIESLQDTSTYKSNQQSVGVSVSAGAGKVSGSLNAARSSVDGNYASVNEQSGIKAGDDGFQIKVAGNTDLKGGKIASTDKAASEGKNSLTTETLTQSDIQNRSDYKAESQSVGVGTGYDGSKLAMNGTGIGTGSSSGSDSSTAKSGISQANIKITDDAAQQAKTGKTAEQTIASTNTNVSSDRDTSGKLTKTWNGQALQADVQAQAQITEMFGKNAAKEIGNYATAKVNELDDKIAVATTEQEKAALIAERSNWQEGGLYRTLLHTTAGMLTGGVDGALGAATSSIAMPQLAKLIENTELPLSVRQALAQSVAAALGGLVGGSSGLIAGIHVEANNRQLHKIQSEKLSALKAGKTKQEQERLNAAACALTQCADGVPSSDPYYSQIRAMQEKGAGYKEELALLRSTGEFNDMDGLDHLNDFLTKNDEARQRISGGVKLVLGTLGTVAGGTVAVSGGAGCAPTVGASCALVPFGLYVATASNDQAQEGSKSVFGNYQSAEGKRVLDSFDIATYPGERDPLLDIGIDAGKLGLTYLLGKYVPKGLAAVDEKLSQQAVGAGGKAPSGSSAGATNAVNDKLLSEADFAGRIPVRADLVQHLSEAKVSGRQISGGHNEDNFMLELARLNGTVVSKTNISSGITEIKYQLPGAKPDKFETKTLYDPRVYSDEQIAEMAYQAAAKGMIQYQISGIGNQYVNVNGISFFVPINQSSGTIRTVFPSAPKMDK